MPDLTLIEKLLNDNWQSQREFAEAIREAFKANKPPVPVQMGGPIHVRLRAFADMDRGDGFVLVPVDLLHQAVERLDPSPAPTEREMQALRMRCKWKSYTQIGTALLVTSTRAGQIVFRAAYRLARCADHPERDLLADLRVICRTKGLDESWDIDSL